MLEKVNEILVFWFGKEPTQLQDQAAKWWQKDPDFDALIREKFLDLHQMACKGDLNDWCKQPRSCLAFIILLDQFSRNMFRDQKQAFLQDEMARNASEFGREHKLDKELSLIERVFFYMPLEHSEDINDQKLCLALMKQLAVEAKQNKDEFAETFRQYFDYAKQHYDIINNFGRFPHRNEILNRESTQEEIVFLQQPNSSF